MAKLLLEPISQSTTVSLVENSTGGHFIRLQRHGTIWDMTTAAYTNLKVQSELVTWCLSRGINITINLTQHDTLIVVNGYLIIQYQQCEFVLSKEEWETFRNFDIPRTCNHDFPDSDGYCKACIDI